MALSNKSNPMKEDSNPSVLAGNTFKLSPDKSELKGTIGKGVRLSSLDFTGGWSWCF